MTLQISFLLQKRNQWQVSKSFLNSIVWHFIQEKIKIVSSMSTIAFTSVYQAHSVWECSCFYGRGKSDDVGFISLKLCFVFCNQDTIKLLYWLLWLMFFLFLSAQALLFGQGNLPSSEKHCRKAFSFADQGDDASFYCMWLFLCRKNAFGVCYASPPLPFPGTSAFTYMILLIIQSPLKGCIVCFCRFIKVFKFLTNI